jgi:hypothetical protein
MPAKRTSRRRTSGPKSQGRIKRAVLETKSGKLKSGPSSRKVKSRKQAIAIGLSEARQSGAKVARKKAA